MNGISCAAADCLPADERLHEVGAGEEVLGVLGQELDELPGLGLHLAVLVHGPVVRVDPARRARPRRPAGAGRPSGSRRCPGSSRRSGPSTTGRGSPSTGRRSPGPGRATVASRLVTFGSAVLFVPPARSAHHCRASIASGLSRVPSSPSAIAAAGLVQQRLKLLRVPARVQVEEAERLRVARRRQRLAGFVDVVPGGERRGLGVETGVLEVLHVDRQGGAVELARKAVERAVVALRTVERAGNVAADDVVDRRGAERLGVDRREQALRDVVATQGRVVHVDDVRTGAVAQRGQHLRAELVVRDRLVVDRDAGVGVLVLRR